MKVGAGDLISVTVVQVPFYLSQMRLGTLHLGTRRLGTLLLQTVLDVSKCAIAEKRDDRSVTCVVASAHPHPML